uniref:Origin recognition complex subunit 1 n=1 Tax=Chrysolophus pictus TaxID=9089 RepID=A0A8C3Q193_CHRPC
MDTRQQSKIIYSWYGKPMSSDRKLRTLQYKGILIKSERSKPERCIQLGDFVLIEGENADQPFVAQLLDLYEDGAQQKHAVVQWFTHITEIPKNKQKLLKRRISSQEVFFDLVSGYDTDIAVETIIESVLVIPLRLKDELPTRLRKEKIFCVKQSWDGKCFKVLSPHTFSMLNEANKKRDGIPNSSSSFVPSDIISSVKKESKKVAWSAPKTKNVEMEIESKHSASKSSLSKKRHSLRIDDGTKNPTARKKLDLNSPTRSSKDKLLEQDVLELLDDVYDSQLLKPTAIKRKVKFTEVLSSPPKITCANDKLKSVFGTAEHQEMFSDTLRLSPYSKVEDSNEKVKNLNMEDDAIVLTGHKELGSQSPAVTPRSRRTCSQETSTRIAEQISLLNMLESKEEEDFLSSSDGSYSSSSEEEDSDVGCTPEKKTKSSRMFSTPKSSRKPSVHTPAKTPRKTPLLGTPRTPRNATPEIPRRSHAAQKPTSVLEEARLRLHVSAVPESLPCREEEFQDIYNFVESKLIDGTGGCMYISGVPGTGKTATVHEVIRCLQRATEDDLPSFQFIEINGMKLTDPHQAYVQILELLTGQKVTATHAAVLLAKLFCTPGPKRKTTVLVVDELDLLWTRKQNVMYNLFDWPTQKHSKLIILAIANTMDLPERIMMNRVSSRLGLTRMSFQPYTYKQLQQIISSRLNSVKAFEEDAIQLVSRKVAALSGDARRCLDICRRAAEICEFSSQKSTREIVRMTHITQAIDEMFSSPYIKAIRNASLHEQIFFKAILAEFRRAGVEEATIQQVYHQHISLCRMEGMQSPTVSDILAICARLGACRLLLLESSNKYLHMRVRLNISQDDVMYALKDD